MTKYRKKTPIVEAVQWTGNMAVVIALVGHDLPTYGEGRNGSLRVPDSTGDIECRLGDWIVKDAAGNIYPVRRGVFSSVYEAVE